MNKDKGKMGEFKTRRGSALLTAGTDFVMECGHRGKSQLIPEVRGSSF